MTLAGMPVGRICFALFLLLPGPREAAATTAISLTVDATGSVRNILHARETIAVSPGPMTLLYPKWLPGEHEPNGPILDMMGLKIMAGTTPLRWRRDLIEMYAFHLTVPSGVRSLDVAFDFILRNAGGGYSAGVSGTPQLQVISWNQVLLYPARPRPDSILVTPVLRLQDGWKFGTALDVARQDGGTIQFRPVSLAMLIDSPVLAGRFLRKFELNAGAPVPIVLNIAGDSAEAVQPSSDLLGHYRELVREALALFGAHHFNRYDFLYTLSDHVTHFGLEHHQSSDDRAPAGTLQDSMLRLNESMLLPHEFVHSWNGKYRRPAGLATGDFTTPMKDDMLWVYEGLTQYLGSVLSGRSGLVDPRQYRDYLAMIAAELDHRPGREWRPLQDDADMASLLYESRSDWSSYRRGVDFYNEGDLIWLEADVTIRQLTQGRKSLDDFCRLFYGPPDSGPALRPYAFQDLVAALNRIAQYDWASFFDTRLQSLSPHAPLGGIEQGGWKLAYSDTVSPFQLAHDRSHHLTDLRYSLGILLGDGGILSDVLPGSPAFEAGMVPDMKMVSVNGRDFSPQVLKEAVRDARNGSSPIAMVATLKGYSKTYHVEYHGGEKYPFLERVDGKPDLVDAIIHPLTAPGK